MRKLRTPLLVAILTLLVLPPCHAAGKMEVPRVIDRDQEITKLESKPLPGGRIGIEGLGPGRPARIATYGSWISSDLMPDDYTTDDFWYDTEILYFIGRYYTPRTRPVVVSFQIRDKAGNIVRSASAEDAPVVDSINTLVWDPTPADPNSPVSPFLPAGTYQLRVKFRQGKGDKNVAGLKYWFDVVPDPGL